MCDCKIYVVKIIKVSERSHIEYLLEVFFKKVFEKFCASFDLHHVHEKIALFKILYKLIKSYLTKKVRSV